jgi:hypothetical protein
MFTRNLQGEIKCYREYADKGLRKGVRRLFYGRLLSQKSVRESEKKHENCKNYSRLLSEIRIVRYQSRVLSQ